MPEGFIGESRRGAYMIWDPSKKGSVTIQRSRGAEVPEEIKTKTEWLYNSKANGGKGGRVKISTPEAAGKWWKGKNAYLANANIHRSIRGKKEGAIAAGSVWHGTRVEGQKDRIGGLASHLDRRGITTKTTAGAYEKTGTAKSRQVGTHALVQTYQKRGFGIDTRTTVPNEWNVGMVRKPGAAPKETISAEGFDRKMQKIRSADYSRSTGIVMDHLKELVPGRGTLAGAAALSGTSAVANSDSKHSDAAKAILPVASVVAGGVAARKLYKTGRYMVENAREIASHAIGAAGSGRIVAGRSLAYSAGRGRKWIGQRLLTGLA